MVPDLVVYTSFILHLLARDAIYPCFHSMYWSAFDGLQLEGMSFLLWRVKRSPACATSCRCQHGVHINAYALVYKATPFAKCILCSLNHLHSNKSGCSSQRSWYRDAACPGLEDSFTHFLSAHLLNTSPVNVQSAINARNVRNEPRSSAACVRCSCTAFHMTRNSLLHWRIYLIPRRIAFKPGELWQSSTHSVAAVLRFEVQ
jgi:hypothetical protein